MPGATPIYGFPYPDPSDLVANYPALGQELAEDIEAVLPTLGGMVRVATATFTAQSAVNINNCFSATYDNYQIVIDFTASANDAIMAFRFRASGTNNTTANYNAYGTYGNSSGQTSATVMQTRTGGFQSLAGTIFRPFISGYTTGVYLAQRGEPGVVFNNYNGMFSHTANNVFDGLSWFPSSGNITGSIRVYGLTNA